nr:helix-turn-helix transcriptional regulator [uncultured Capnocytophaga sp.]
MIEQPEVKIKQAREVKRVSQDFVAAQLGISTRAYSKIESGETQLTITRLNEICAILQVDPMKVLGFDDKKVFNINNNSSGTCNGEYHLNQIPEKLIAQYEETIASLKEQIIMLKEMLNK